VKILIVSQYFWPETFCISELAASLKERGHEVEVLTGVPNYPSGRRFEGYGRFGQKEQIYRNIKIHRVPLITRGRGRTIRLVLNYLSFVVSACLLGPWLCRDRYDVIFVYEPSPVTVCLPALLLKWLRKIPVIFWVQDLWPESISATGAINSAFILNLVSRLVRFIYSRCDRILVQSEAFRAPIERLGADPRKIEYYPNNAEALYVPTVLDAEAPERMEFPKGFCVMFAGNIGAAQDFETILAAAELLKGHRGIHWVIVGDGRQFAWVKAEVQRRVLEETVHLLGRRQPSVMPRYFALADVMLVTLRKDPIFALTIPAKIQAYLACGKPVLAGIDGEGARIVNAAQAGLTCPAEQPEVLANCVLEFYRMDPAERQAMGINGRAYCERHFNPHLLIERLEEIMGHVEPSKGAAQLHDRCASIDTSRRIADVGETE